jgi:adenylosuccinate synthase
LRQAVQVNSISGLCLTKLDVLDGLETIKICVGYDSAGSTQSGPNVGSEFYEGVTPIYEEVEGWQDTTLGIRAIEDLPAAARRYIHLVEEAVGAPVDIISTGPDRKETILLNNPFADVG